jgi:hypothetical protein
VPTVHQNNSKLKLHHCSVFVILFVYCNYVSGEEYEYVEKSWSLSVWGWKLNFSAHTHFHGRQDCFGHQKIELEARKSGSESILEFSVLNVTVTPTP